MKRTKTILHATLTAILICAFTPANAGDALPANGSLNLKWNMRSGSTDITYRPYTFLKESIVPVSMFTVGSLVHDNRTNGSIIRNEIYNTDGFRIPDYLQYSPLAIMGVMKIAGIEGRSDILRTGVTDAVAIAAMYSSVQALKYSVKRERPDGSTEKSFPSGHTATAFMTATMLHKEYGQTISPWYSAVGYGIAGTIAISRVVENRHWCSDVLAGAGIGTFSTLLAYEVSDILFKERHLQKEILQTISEEPSQWNFSMSSSCSIWSAINEKSGISDGFKPSYSIGLDMDYLPWYVGPTVGFGLTQIQWTGEQDLLIDSNCDRLQVFWANAGVTAHIPFTTSVGCFARFTAGFQSGGSYGFQSTGSNQPLSLDIQSGMIMRNAIGISIKATEHSSLSAFMGTDWYHRVWTAMNAGTTFTISI